MDPRPIVLTSPGNKIEIQISLSLKDICTRMFTAALLTVSKRWKQPKCPSAQEWIGKMQNMFRYKGIIFDHKKK